MNQQPQKLSDIVTPGTTADLRRRLADTSLQLVRLCKWIIDHHGRTEESATICNLLSAARSYLILAAENAENHLSVLALCVRSLYELDLRTRLVLTSPNKMREWEAEAAADKIELLEGILQLSSSVENTESRRVLQNEISRLQSLLERHGMPPVDHIPSTAALAKSAGLHEDHKALFKLFSKLVHPSSYLVNDYSSAASPEVLAVLQIHLQLYAGDIIKRVCVALSIPDDATRMETKPGNHDA
jgi:hypothetical protein